MPPARPRRRWSTPPARPSAASWRATRSRSAVRRRGSTTRTPRIDDTDDVTAGGGVTVAGHRQRRRLRQRQGRHPPRPPATTAAWGIASQALDEPAAGRLQHRAAMPVNRSASKFGDSRAARRRLRRRATSPAMRAKSWSIIAQRDLVSGEAGYGDADLHLAESGVRLLRERRRRADWPTSYDPSRGEGGAAVPLRRRRARAGCASISAASRLHRRRRAGMAIGGSGGCRLPVPRHRCGRFQSRPAIARTTATTTLWREVAGSGRRHLPSTWARTPRIDLRRSGLRRCPAVEARAVDDLRRFRAAISITSVRFDRRRRAWSS
jgi:hypothetical protein